MIIDRYIWRLLLVRILVSAPVYSYFKLTLVTVEKLGVGIDLNLQMLMPNDNDGIMIMVGRCETQCDGKW